jgi:hypothetical protein
MPVVGPERAHLWRVSGFSLEFTGSAGYIAAATRPTGFVGGRANLLWCGRSLSK